MGQRPKVCAPQLPPGPIGGISILQGDRNLRMLVRLTINKSDCRTIFPIESDAHSRPLTGDDTQQRQMGDIGGIKARSR